MLALTLAVPAFALEESDVEAAVSSSSREAVTGNVLVWFLCAVGFLKVSQKIDSFMASIGVNVGHTGGSMLGEAMVAFKGVSLAAGMAGKVVGNFADRASSRAGAAASGSSGFLQGGLAGVVSRKITNDAVRTATQTTQKASSSTMSAAHQATERTVNAERQAASVVHQAKQTRSESASQKSQMGVTHQQVASSTRTASVSSLRRESQHSVGLGGRIFTNSMLEGGRFANDVIGMVAAGDLHSTGSITGEFASQALSSYMGITAQGDAAPQISYSGIEIGGGRITGTEYSPEHPEGISFGMYHTGQYAAPDGEHQKVFSADGAQWYKQYAVDTVIKKPFTAPDGEIDYVHRFYTQRQPGDMPYEEWQRVQLTEAKVLAYLKQALCRQNAKPERDEIRLVKQKYSFVYKAYSRKMAKLLTDEMRAPVPIYQAVLNDEPERFPGYERLLRRKRREYDNQEQPFSEMAENAQLADWIGRFQYWDAQNHAYIHLNPLQSHDVNLTLQKRYAFLQWEQGSGKTPAAIFTGKHRVEMGAVHSIWVISSAISIRNNWDVILKGAGFSYVFVERLADLQRIRPGDFVILTLNKVSQYKKQIGRYIKQLAYKIQFIFDESDNISNPSSKQTLSVLSCFRRCKYKLLTTGTSTRNNISEFAPQLELLYNNSINMISWCRTLYSYDKRSADMEHKENPYYAMPIPAYKKGYRLFANSHLPEKITVFGVGQRNQDIYNADELDRLLGKTVITRTFEEVTGKDIRRIHQMPIPFLPEEREVYNIVLKEFYRIQREYYSSTGNSRKDALMRLIQQITLLLRISAAPDCMKEYEGETPLKEMAVVEALARWPEEVVAIGVRHTTVLDRYAAAIREYLPDRPLFVVTGSTVTFAKRRALRDILRDSQNGILLCTQQSLPSSVNFEFVNKIIIPEMHYNNAGMSQFYMRFVRYTSTEKKDLYFPIYIGSLESNLMQMVLAKEKLTMFMKGQDADMDEIYAKFGVDYDLLSTLMTRETDDEGHLRIHWGEQKIA